LLSDQAKSGDIVLFENNYKAGFEFSYPIFTRKERSKLKMTKIKQEETNYKFDQKTQEIVTKVRTYLNKVNNFQKIIDQQSEMVSNYKILVRSEQIKFDNGESSLFKLNIRENKRITAEMKLIEFKTEYARALADLRWSAGILGYETLRMETSLP